MRVTYLDATEHPGTVQEYMIMSAPGIVINGELAYTGSVSDTVQASWT
jgi:predicted thioredoxin/glutaredoxin